jgi:hypothetical protein
LLWWVTYGIARDANKSAKTLISMERPYVTGGGDFENETGKELYRLDVENHGKTPAFMIAYDLQFAKLEELRKEYILRPDLSDLSTTGILTVSRRRALAK